MNTPRAYPAGDGGSDPERLAMTSTAAPEAIPFAGDHSEPGIESGVVPVGAPEATSGIGAGAGGGSGSSGASGTSGPSGTSSPSGTSGVSGPSGTSGTSVTRVAEPATRQVRRLRLLGTSGAVPRARDFTRQALHDWGWLPARTPDQRAAAEDVLLVVSELVTNACLHADGADELRIGSEDRQLRLEVVDHGGGEPAPRTPHRAGRPGGHGMFIVQRLCSDWGVVRNPGGGGKTVWAELAAPL